VALSNIVNHKITLNRYRMRIVRIVKKETPIGNHTGAIHGTGMRNNTSIVVGFGGHLIRIYSDK
jgi:hypothetical protein